jgi:hypothetical protein
MSTAEIYEIYIKHILMKQLNRMPGRDWAIWLEPHYVAVLGYLGEDRGSDTIIQTWDTYAALPDALLYRGAIMNETKIKL